MAHEIWFTSDWHFNHFNILKFTRADGSPLRPFKHLDEMNEELVSRFNERVKEGHKVYFLGDMAFGRQEAAELWIRRLNGSKRMIHGNHDNYDYSFYAKYFRLENCWRQFKQFDPPFICTHVPLHTGQLRNFKEDRPVFNVHGHLHQNFVLKENGPPKHDLRYINVCVETRNYYPVHLDELTEIMKERTRAIQAGQ